MRKSPHFRGLFGSGSTGPPPIVTIAVDDGPLPVEFNKTTIILGATLLANDIIPNGATVISVQVFAGGTGVVVGGDVHWTQIEAPPFASSFTYTIQDNVTAQTSTATVTVVPFNAAISCVDDGPSFDITTEFHPLILSKFGGGSITANDTFGGAASPPNTANPVTVTVLTQTTPPYVTLFDSFTPGPGPGIYTFPVPSGINQIEIECWGAEGGRGGDLSAPGAASGQPNQVPGRGAHRLVSNLAATPGQILSIAVGGEGGDALAVGGEGGGGPGGLGGAGFADNATSPSLIFGFLDSFGFPDGDIVSFLGGSGLCTGCDGAGGANGSNATSTNPATGAGGGGGAGSAVTVGPAQQSSGVPVNILGPVLNCAGGGGGGSGARVIPDTTRGHGQDGGPPNSEQILSDAFHGSHGDTAAGEGATGGGGGGFRGGDSFPKVDSLGRRRGFGGESNDERYKEAGERFAGNKSPSIIEPFASGEVWPAFSRSTTTEFPSLQVGDGRVRIRGRTIVDQLGGTQFPINCKVVDLGATIEVTPDIPFNLSGSNECSFFYFLTDTVTGETSGVCEVKLDIIANSIVAVNDGPFNVSENLTNAIVASEATLLVNDSFNVAVNLEVVSFFFNISAASLSGGNLIVDTGSIILLPASRSGTVTYQILDPVMPAGFELLANRKADTAVVAINITPVVLPPFVVIHDTGFGAAGAETTFTIPPTGINQIEVICMAGDGGLSGGYGGDPLGLPGPPSIMASSCGGEKVRVTNIPVVAGEQLRIATGSGGVRGQRVSINNTPLGGAGGLGNTTLGNYNFPGGGNANGAAGADGLTGDFGGVFAGSAGGGGGGTTVANSGGVILCAAGGGGGGAGHSSSAGQSSLVACVPFSVGEISSDGAPGVKTSAGPLGGGGGGFRGGAVIFGPDPPADPGFGRNEQGDRGFQNGGQIVPGSAGGSSGSNDGRVIILGRLVP